MASAEREVAVRHSRSLIACLSLVLSGFAAGETASAVVVAPPRSAWSPVVNLTRSARSTYGPDVAASPDGRTLAVWTHGEKARSQVMAAWRRPGGSWTSPRRVPGTRGAVEAEIAFDGDGDLVLAWTVGRLVKAVRRPADGSWGDPVSLHRTAAGVRGTRPVSLDLAVNGHGRAALSWETRDDDQDATYARSRVQAVVGGAAGRWGQARTLSLTNRDAFGAEVAVSRTGRVTVVWDEVAGSRGQIMTTSRAAGHRWERSRPLSRRLTHPADPQIAAAPPGELAVAWDFGGRMAGIKLRRWSPAGGWSPAVRVPAVKVDAWWLDLGIDGAGTVTLGWSNQAKSVWSARQTSAGSWTRARVAPADSVFYSLHVLVNRAGDAIIGWDGNGNAGRHVVEAAYRPRSGSWEPATRLSDLRGDAGGLALTLGSDGSATAAWLFARDFKSNNRVQARHLAVK